MSESLLWAELSPKLREELKSHSSLIRLKRGEVAFRQGEVPRGLYLVEKGLVGLTLLAASGREHLLRFFRQGQFFGHRALFSKDGHYASAIALESTDLRMVPKDLVEEAIQDHPQILREIVVRLAQELRRCELNHVMVLENQVLPRTAQALIYLKDLHPHHNWTRQEIANFCGSTVSTIIKTLAEIEARGLIRQDGRLIEVLDRKGLLALQEEGNGG